MTNQEALQLLLGTIQHYMESSGDIDDAVHAVREGGFRVTGIQIIARIEEIEEKPQSAPSDASSGLDGKEKDNPFFDADFLRSAHIVPNLRVPRPTTFHRWPSKRFKLGLFLLATAFSISLFTGCGSKERFQLHCPPGSVEVTPAPLPNRTVTPDIRSAPVCGVL